MELGFGQFIVFQFSKMASKALQVRFHFLLVARSVLVGFDLVFDFVSLVFYEFFAFVYSKQTKDIF